MDSIMTLACYLYISLVLLPTLVISQACPPDFCSNDGTCYIDSDDGNPVCVCKPGYRGMMCELIDNTQQCTTNSDCNGATCTINGYCDCTSIGDYFGPTCQDKKALVGFEDTAYVFREGEGMVSAYITRTFNTDIMTTVRVTALSAVGVVQATVYDDYTFEPNPMTEQFNQGDDRRRVDFLLINDNAQEADEYFDLELSIDTASGVEARVLDEARVARIKIKAGDGSTGCNAPGSSPSFYECMNGGTCNIDGTCSCTTGYDGQTCNNPVDTIPPVISCIHNISQTVNNGVGGTTVNWTEPTATDNSGTVTLATRSHNPGSFFPVGTTNVTYKFVDGSNNSANCTFNVSVIEQKHTFSCEHQCMNGGFCEETSDGSFICNCLGTGYFGEACTDPPPGSESSVVLTDATIIIIAVFGATVVFLVVVLCVIVCCWYQRRQRHRERSKQRDELTLRKQFEYEPSPITRRRTGAFDRNKLTFYEQLGSGAFAVVYRAKAKGIVTKGVEAVVAVKMLKETSTEDDKMNFLKEVEMYKSLKHHPNIIGMLGTCIDKEPHYIIMEYASEGNLQSHLKKIRKDANPPYMNLQSANNSTHQFLTPNEIMTFAVQIARGMVYLASQKCVHRDLATRNILLGEGLVCKVSDFGLARDMAEENAYEMKSRGRVPLRWMALESLLDKVYSSKSDVWSYGVLLWELVTLGSHPYPGMTGGQVISELKKGYRLPKPEHCSEQIYDVMCTCWQENPEERPTFMQIQKKVENMLEDAQGYLCMRSFKKSDYVYLQADQNSLDSRPGLDD
ncbi:uncharacterized protein [Amphiura filiformis]|uniref:uncharacterized protein n=1 Tax=Amphiura filiformis TaxID=82378 RepID=UPI003B226D28